jgi:hypothetical protein
MKRVELIVSQSKEYNCIKKERILLLANSSRKLTTGFSAVVYLSLSF